MPQIINTNISSLNAQRNLDQSQNAQDTALQRLSSGLRVNSSKDDAAGLQIANRLDAQVRGLNVASRNAGDGVSLAQIAEGSIESISTSLQRLRELAVQSSNATNGDSERAALNEEATQLIAEIERTSGSATFNGVNLLDGSFQNKSFQVGANVGDEVSVSLGSVDTSSLGAAESSGVSGSVSKAPLDVASDNLDLVGGDLVINSVSINASTAGDDGFSTALQASSAIAKAAAINAASEQTGVVATVNANTVQGTNLTSLSASGATPVDFSLNGETFAISITAQTTPDGVKNELQRVADTLNGKTGVTGVTAEVVQGNGPGTGFRIDLTAEDGRNIVLDPTVAAADDDTDLIGLATNDATTDNDGRAFVGNVTLSSVDGGDISLTTTTGDIDNAGFEVGTFASGQAAAVGDNRTTSSALVAGDLIINGTSIGASLASDDTASTADSDESGIAIAAAVNRSTDSTGVTATVNENRLSSGTLTAANVFTGVSINGVSIDATVASLTLGEKVASIVDNVNAKAGQTGVTAEALGADKFTLIAADGRNIEVTGSNAIIDDGFAAATTGYAGVTLTSGGQIDIASNTGDLTDKGFEVGSYGATESGTLLKDVDISTAGGAKAAISAVDNAISTVNAERAKLGSIQTRFENVISANQIAVENFSASKSRIVDADFAAETAALSRSQVLQQAGISVLAQANARPQQVLSLLQ